MRDRQHVRVRPAEVAEQRQARRVRGGPGHGHADPDDRVGAEPRLVRRPVQVDQGLVDQPLVVGLVAEQFRLDLVDDALDRPGHPLAAVFRAAVPQLDRLERAGRGPARHSGPPDGPVVQRDLDLEGRVAAGVQDLPGMDRFYGGHRRLLACVRVAFRVRAEPMGSLPVVEPSRETAPPRRGHAVPAEGITARRGRPSASSRLTLNRTLLVEPDLRRLLWQRASRRGSRRFFPPRSGRRSPVAFRPAVSSRPRHGSSRPTIARLSPWPPHLSPMSPGGPPRTRGRGWPG